MKSISWGQMCIRAIRNVRPAEAENAPEFFMSRVIMFSAKGPNGNGGALGVDARIECLSLYEGKNGTVYTFPWEDAVGPFSAYIPKIDYSGTDASGTRVEECSDDFRVATGGKEYFTSFGEVNAYIYNRIKCELLELGYNARYVEQEMTKEYVV